MQELSEETEARSLAGHSAIQVLTSLFRNHEEYGTEEDMKSFIARAKSATDENAIKALLLWSNVLVKKYVTKGGNSSVVEASTPQDLLQGLRQYTINAMDEEEEESEDPSPWPLIKKIK